MSCRLGVCEMNNNRAKGKKISPRRKNVKKRCCAESSSDWSDSSSEWSDSDDSCSDCSTCSDSSSTCTCSECNMETDSDDSCQGPACYQRGRKPAKKNGKMLICNRGVCEWVPKKKTKKVTKKVAEKKNAKGKKTKNSRNCC